MKHSLRREEYFLTPQYQLEVMTLKTLITENWWHKGYEKYFDFSKKCKTSVGFMADELGEAISNYKHGQLSEEQVANKFRCTLDLIDYYSMRKK